VRRLAIGMLTLVAGLTLFGPAIQAQDDTDPDASAAITVGRVDVLQVSGFMDPILVDAIDGRVVEHLREKNPELDDADLAAESR